MGFSVFSVKKIQMMFYHALELSARTQDSFLIIGISHSARREMSLEVQTCKNGRLHVESLLYKLEGRRGCETSSNDSS